MRRWMLTCLNRIRALPAARVLHLRILLPECDADRSNFIKVEAGCHNVAFSFCLIMVNKESREVCRTAIHIFQKTVALQHKEQPGILGDQVRSVLSRGYNDLKNHILHVDLVSIENLLRYDRLSLVLSELENIAILPTHPTPRNTSPTIFTYRRL